MAGSVDASAITAGTIGHARLGTGGGGSSKYLREDSTWQTVAGSGDVVGDDTSTTTQNIVAYSGTGGKNITELTGTQGDVLYHNGTNWAKLGAGTSGHFLKTLGAGANPAWDAAGGGTAASQAEQETGSSTTVFTTPGRQHFHPSAAKAWVCSTQSTTTIQRGYNVASVADTAAGQSTITFTTNMSDTTYTVIPNAEHNSASGTTQTYQVDNGTRAVGSYRIESWQVDGTEVLTDPSAAWFSVVFGDI